MERCNLKKSFENVILLVAAVLMLSACTDDNGGYPMSVKLPRGETSKEVVGDKTLFSFTINVNDTHTVATSPNAFYEAEDSDEDWQEYLNSGKCKASYEWLTVVNYGNRLELTATANTTRKKRKLRVEGSDGIPPNIIIDVTQE